jgi:hypothetical protein
MHNEGKKQSPMEKFIFDGALRVIAGYVANVGLHEELLNNMHEAYVEGLQESNEEDRAVDLIDPLQVLASMKNAIRQLLPHRYDSISPEYSHRVEEAARILGLKVDGPADNRALGKGGD